MTEVAEFLQRFIQHDYEARRAFYLETDDAAFQKKVAEVAQFYSPEDHVYSGFSRGQKSGAPLDPMDNEMAERVVPRVLFQVKKYAHPELGAVFRAYLSGEFKHNRGAYSKTAYLQGTQDGLRIISVEGRCLSCRGRGKVGEESCRACSGKGWEHGSGRRLESLGELVEAHKFQSPTDPVSRADYESAQTG